jgi:HEPN domain-containing protein
MQTAQLIIELKPMIIDVACFHCQQAVEKYLKAFLIYNNKPAIKTHSIEYLLHECNSIDESFLEIDFKNLDEYAVDVRYPDSFLQPDLKEAQEYYSIALTIQKMVLEKIKI